MGSGPGDLDLDRDRPGLRLLRVRVAVQAEGAPGRGPAVEERGRVEAGKPATKIGVNLVV